MKLTTLLTSYSLTSLGCMPLLLLPLACAAIDVDHTTETNTSVSANQTTRKAVNTTQRSTLFGTVKALEGRWTTPEGGESIFELTSGGSVMRETMEPGKPHEMVNMYSLDGNDLCMTHYCAGGNQPHMRAATFQNSAIAFQADGVSDYKESDVNYMGSMTLKIVDADTIEQHWYSHSDEGIGEPMIFRYQRAD